MPETFSEEALAAKADFKIELVPNNGPDTQFVVFEKRHFFWFVPYWEKLAAFSDGYADSHSAKIRAEAWLRAYIQTPKYFKRTRVPK